MTMINGNTQIYGILGYPVGHSFSPRIHNAAFNQRKINSVYLPFPIQSADKNLITAIKKIGIRGLSVTIPHKNWACKIADTRDDPSACCEASNTLLISSDGRIDAYNTDGHGAIKALHQFVPDLRGKRFLIIGYGGSASAIAFQLMLYHKPVVIAITGRNIKKSRQFATRLAEKTNTRTQVFATKLDDIEPEEIDIIIHTTPLGMSGQSQELPIRDDFIQSFHCVFDIVYNPANTVLLRHAARKKAVTIPGYLMLLYQAVLQFELFTGKSAPENLMEKELLAALKSSK